MKFLDLNGLKHLLGKIVKYDKGTSNVSSINDLTVNNKIKTAYIQFKGTVSQAHILFPNAKTISFEAGDIVLNMEANQSGLHLKKHTLLEKLYPEEAETLKNTDLFITIADILSTLKEKGIM